MQSQMDLTGCDETPVVPRERNQVTVIMYFIVECPENRVKIK